MIDVSQFQENILGLLKTKSIKVPVNDDAFMRQTTANVQFGDNRADMKDLQNFIRIFMDEVSFVEDNFKTLMQHSEQEFKNLKDKIQKKLNNIMISGK